MTIKSSGSLSFTEIVAEWTGSTPHSLSEYYSGGSLVPSGSVDGSGNAIPSSGNPISFSDFYDTTVFVQAGSATVISTSQTITAPQGANALLVQNINGGGGGGHGSLGYDRANGESSGGGGAGAGQIRGAFIFGTQFYYEHGAGGTAGGTAFNLLPGEYAQGVGYGGGDGGDSKLRLDDASGTVIITAGGGAGSKTTVKGGVQGPIRENAASAGGTASVDTSISSGSSGFVYSAGGTTTGGTSITAPDIRNGFAGPAGGTCTGDNCAIAGLAGGNVGFGYGGGAGGSTVPEAGNNALNSGGGGGGGGTVNSIVRNGGNGGAGGMSFIWVRI